MNCPSCNIGIKMEREGNFLICDECGHVLEVPSSDANTGLISFHYYRTGDYVLTTLGVGLVVDDERAILTENDLRYSEVLIQHKSPYSENPDNKPVWMSRSSITKSNQEEYNQG